jgi:hypothetical protein
MLALSSGMRLSCGALKKDPFLDLRASAASGYTAEIDVFSLSLDER